MRAGTLGTLVLLLAWGAAISVLSVSADAVAPQATPDSPQLAPSPSDFVTPPEELPRPMPDNLSLGEAETLDSRVATTEPSGQQAHPAGPCLASQTGCNRCGCWRHKALCGQMPFGASVHAAMKTQICNGLAARMVLYHYDFCDDAGPNGDMLNEHGRARLTDIVEMFSCLGCHPIVIEHTPCNLPLDAARREYVVRLLSQMNAPIPSPLVIVGSPESPALSGREAILLDKNLLGRTRDEGKNPAPSPSMTDSGGSQSGMLMPGLPSGTSGQ